MYEWRPSARRSGGPTAITLVVIYNAEHVSADYGTEWNASIAAKVKKPGFMIKYADYSEGVLASARDTQKFWMQMEYVW